MMTFLLFAPASTKWLGWRKTQKIPKGPLTIGRFCAVILRYSSALRVISDILWSSCYEVINQKTLVKHRWSYKVRITVYILKPSAFCQTPVYKSLIGNLARHSFSFFDRNKTWPQTSKTSEWFNGKAITSRTMAITEIRRSSNSVLTYSLLTDVLPL